MGPGPRYDTVRTAKNKTQGLIYKRHTPRVRESVVGRWVRIRRGRSRRGSVISIFCQRWALRARPWPRLPESRTLKLES